MKVKNNPKVGVLIQTYNDGKYLIDALKSIQNQTYKNIQIFIYDDGSSKKNQRIYLKYIKQNNFTYIYGNNRGIVKASNNLLKIARKSDCQLFAKMDGDDLSHKSRIRLQVKYLIKNNLDLVGCNFYRIGKSGKILERNNCSLSKVSMFNRLCVESIFAHGSILFKRELIDKNILKYKSLKSKTPYPEDYNMFCSLFRKIKIGSINKFLYTHRFHNKSYSFENRKIYNNQLKISSKLFFKKNKKIFKEYNENFNLNNFFDLLIYLKILFRHKNFNNFWFVKKLTKSLKIQYLFQIIFYYLHRKFLKFFYA